MLASFLLVLTFRVFIKACALPNCRMPNGVIELVDKIDQKTRNYSKLGAGVKLGDDLLMEVEVAGESAKSPTNGSNGKHGEYVDMEPGEEIYFDPRTPSRRRFIKVVAVATFVIALLVGIVTTKGRSSNKVQTPSTHNDDDFVQSTHTTTTTTGSSPTAKKTPAPHTKTTPSPTAATASAPKTSTSTATVPTPAPTSGLWPTKAPLIKFKICPPHIRIPKDKSIYLMANLTIVPEDKDTIWEYTFSSMDISDEASVIAVGLSDYSRDTDYAVGLVRVYAWNCLLHKYKQLGQDLLGGIDGEQFGYRISSSKDGMIMAVSGLQTDVEDVNGFVQVFYMDTDRKSWIFLGSTIENLEDSDDYYNLGIAMDLSDRGDHLAVMGAIDEQNYLCRVFEFVNDDWFARGNDITIKISESYFDFEPQLDLSEDGTTLSMGDPQFGLLQFNYKFETNKWSQGDTKTTDFDGDSTTYISSIDMDNKGNIIAFASLWQLEGEKYVNNVKVVDYNQKGGATIYENEFAETAINLNVAVSNDATVAAVVAYRTAYEDSQDWGYDEIGAMTLIASNGTGWHQVQEEMGVPGGFIQLSGDGHVAVVGSDAHIAIYGVNLNRTYIETDGGEIAPDESTNQDTQTQEEVAPENCKPFYKATENGHVLDLLNLPVPPDTDEEHSLSVALSKDGTFVAIGMDTFDGEDRGLARVFAYNCTTLKYEQVGQDLYGMEEFDGFGQSVDLTETPDGILNMVVGANQPPPGKTGFVVAFEFDEKKNEWLRKGKRIKNVKQGVEDIGQVVRLSNDASTIAIVGNIIDDDFGDTGSFVRVLEYDASTNFWQPKGTDIVNTVSYTDYGTMVRISLDGTGDTLAVTGSYSQFGSVLYKWDSKKGDWANTTLSVPRSNDDDWADYEFFDGFDVGLSEDGTSIALGGNWYSSDPVVRVFELDDKQQNWTSVSLTDDYYFGSSVALSADGTSLAVGDSGDAGALYVVVYGEDQTWTQIGKVEGKAEKDSLGARVAISQDGRVAAATSKAGYISFFLTNISDE